jgi:antitoxin HicB
MIYAYPARLTQDELGNTIVQFSDIPEAITIGKTKHEALKWAEDALVVALSGYMDDKRDIPKPSIHKHNEPVVIVPPMEAIKLAIYQTMKEKGITQNALGKLLNIDPRQIRRILNINHNTGIPYLIRTLEVIGKSLIIDIKDSQFV